MKSFFTSSLDDIDPPSPYVNAMNWDTLRSQFRSKSGNGSGNRNCVLALGSLNPDSTELSGSRSHGLDIPLIVQNTSKTQFVVKMQAEPDALSALAVDACFGSGDSSFLDEIPVSVLEKSERDGSDWLSEEQFDLELELLESVQEIALALVRTAPKRTVSGSQATNPVALK